MYFSVYHIFIYFRTILVLFYDFVLHGRGYAKMYFHISPAHIIMKKDKIKFKPGGQK